MWLEFAVVTIFILYFFFTRNHDYWANRNVKHDRPLPCFGNSFKNIVALETITQLADKIYNKYPSEKIVGFYQANTPTLLIRDPEIVRHILSVDFQYFYPRGFSRKAEKEPLFRNLFHADGDTWKLLRQRLTAAFTSSKLKNMYPLVVRCAEKLQAVTADLAAKGTEYDARELMARFTTEFIGACGFGIEMDSINNEQSQFRQLGKHMFSAGLQKFVKVQLMAIFPLLKNYFGPVMDNVIEESMTSLLTTIREQRGGKPIGRHDFVDLLLELEQKGTLVGESIENPPKKVEFEMDIKCQAAQLFIFFAAGFETSSSATSFLLHQLAHNPAEQKKVQENIDHVMANYDNYLCYDAVSEMTVLDMAFKEAMRMFPSLGVLNRVCARKYTIPRTGVEITPGVKILIPVQALQNDPGYWEHPNRFWPERFAVAPSHRFVYLPFGEGPRACIGERLGQMQSLAGLAAVLHRFSVKPGPSSKPKLELNNFMNVVQGVKGGIPLIFSERKP